MPPHDAPTKEVLAFWFSHRDRWWRSSAEFDEDIRRRFGFLHAEILSGEHEDWREMSAGALAYVLVLDQFSRNMFRRDARACRGDDSALAASRQVLARGDDGALSQDERTFATSSGASDASPIETRSLDARRPPRSSRS